MTAIRAVCFDLGGVLAHVALNWAEAMDAAGLNSSEQFATPLEQLPAFKLYQAGQLDIEAYLDEVAALLGISAEAALRVHEHILIRPTEGTLELVRALNAKPILTGCLSNTNSLHWPVITDPVRFPNVAELKLKAASQLIGFNKPAPEAYRAFEQLAGVAPKEVLFFEDGPHNVEGAQQVGWNAVLIDPLKPQEPQLRRALEEFEAL